MCSHCSGGCNNHATCCIPRHSDHGCSSRDRCSHRRHRSRSRSPSASPSRRRILRDLGDVLESRRQNNEISHLLDDFLHQSRNNDRHGSNDSNHNDESRSILRQIADELLGRPSSRGGDGNNSNRGWNNSLTTRSSSTDRDILVDLLLRISSSTDNNSSIERYVPLDPYRRRVFDDIIVDPGFYEIEQAWMANTASQMPYASMMCHDLGMNSMYSTAMPMPMTVPVSMRLPGCRGRRDYAVTGPFPTAATPLAMQYCRNGVAPPSWLGRMNARR